MNNGQCIYPNSPAAIFMFDCVMKQHPFQKKKKQKKSKIKGAIIKTGREKNKYTVDRRISVYNII